MEYHSNNVEKGCHWHFAPQQGGREDGPNDAMMQNFKESPYKSLVREAIQNSLDAVLDRNQPVRVEFAFTSINSRNYTNFFDLKDHIIGEQSDDAVNLDYTDNGITEMNIVRSVSLREGRNTIKVLFSDNMRHAIKLKTYENK